MNLPSQPDQTGQFSLAYFFQQWSNIARVINGNLSLGSPSETGNVVDSWAVVKTPATANEEFSVPHTLGYIPNGYIILSVDQAAIVYKGVTPWTTSAISLKCNIASVNVTLLVV